MWKAWILEDGELKEVCEGQRPWNEIKCRVVRLGIEWRGRFIELPRNMAEYGQAKSASASIAGGQITIESRWIGYRKDGQWVRLRCFEANDQAQIEIA